MDMITLKMSKEAAIAVWHYFNASMDAQRAFDESYSRYFDWRAEKFKAQDLVVWENIDNQLKELGIDPYEDWKPKKEEMIEVDGKKYSVSTIKEALREYVK